MMSDRDWSFLPWLPTLDEVLERAAWYGGLLTIAALSGWLGVAYTSASMAETSLRATLDARAATDNLGRCVALNARLLGATGRAAVYTAETRDALVVWLTDVARRGPGRRGVPATDK